MKNGQKDLFPTFRRELRELGKYKNPLKIPIPLGQFLLTLIGVGMITYLGIRFISVCFIL